MTWFMMPLDPSEMMSPTNTLTPFEGVGVGEGQELIRDDQREDPQQRDGDAARRLRGFGVDAGHGEAPFLDRLEGERHQANRESGHQHDRDDREQVRQMVDHAARPGPGRRDEARPERLAPRPGVREPAQHERQPAVREQQRQDHPRQGQQPVHQQRSPHVDHHFSARQPPEPPLRGVTRRGRQPRVEADEDPEQEDVGDGRAEGARHRGQEPSCRAQLPGLAEGDREARGRLRHFRVQALAGERIDVRGQHREHGTAADADERAIGVGAGGHLAGGYLRDETIERLGRGGGARRRRPGQDGRAEHHDAPVRVDQRHGRVVPLRRLGRGRERQSDRVGRGLARRLLCAGPIRCQRTRQERRRERERPPLCTIHSDTYFSILISFSRTGSLA